MEAVSVVLTDALARIPALDVHVVTVDRSVLQPMRGTWQGATIHRLPQKSGSLLRFASGAGRVLIGEYLKELRPDVVHAHDTFGIMSSRLEFPRAFTIHGFIHEDTRLRGGISRLTALLWQRKELQVWAEQPHIISISPYVRERLRGVARGVIHDIENPVGLDCFSVQREERRGVIFSAAAICRRKNTLGLIKAFVEAGRTHPALRLRIAGAVTESDYGEIVQRFTQESGMADRIDFLGSVGTTQIRQELIHASIFALVSFEEGAPMGIAEAMAAGVPIVTSNRCGMPYMLRHGESGYLVNPHDTADIARCFDRLTHDDALRARMGQAARAFAERSFHPAAVAERSVRVYQDAIETFTQNGRGHSAATFSRA